MLYIYSGDVPELDGSALNLLGPRHRLTLIPVSPRQRAAARQTITCLRHKGLHARLPGSRFYRDSTCLRNIICNSDAIYLMGGNTFEFLAYARAMNLFKIMADFETAGGLILAESAGSIILSPTIATALIPTTCPDKEQKKLPGYHGMGRINFHISPHFESASPHAEQELHELQSLANYSQYPVWVLQDGEGLILENDAITAKIGQPRLISPAANTQLTELENWMPAWAKPV